MSFAIVQCGCHRYPILDGILVLRRGGPHEVTAFDRAVALLEDGHTEAAVRAVLEPDERRPSQRVIDRLARLGVPGARGLAERRLSAGFDELFGASPVGFADAAALLRRRSYADYLEHRFANPSFLAAVPLLCLLDEIESHPHGSQGRVLDLCCGVGQSSALMRRMFPSLEVISVDQDFNNLFLARRYVVGDGILVCADAERPLPFPDDSFDGVFCLDAFHYIGSKLALVEEVDRVVRNHGLWLFAHLHNSLTDNPAAGIPLAPPDYRRLFEPIRGELLVESRVLGDYVASGSLHLGEPDATALERAHALSFVGCRRTEFWRDRANLDEIAARVMPDLVVNPIYAEAGVAAVTTYRMRWPNPDLESECGAVRAVLPESMQLDPAITELVRHGRMTEDRLGEARRLMRQFVLVPRTTLRPTGRSAADR